MSRIRRTLLLCLVTFAPLCAARVSAQLLKPVKTTAGLLQGTPATDPKITVFKGIPYATPPVGNLRWAPPQPVAPWQGIRPADHFGASCTQVGNERQPWTHEFIDPGPVSEDCLFLNLWTPAKTSSAKLPVYVFIHGGGFREGSGAMGIYNGEGLAKKGILTITINYRLGVLGSFAHPELTRESPHHASGNYGLLDQIAALQWVHDNVAAFGGDPNRVAISGQSAGASSVFYLLASPLAKGLFQRAISQSVTGYVLSESNLRSRESLEQDGLKFAASAGVQSLAELRALTAMQLLAVKPQPAPGSNAPAVWRFGTVVDGYALPASVGEIFAQGKQNRVSFMGGNTAGDNGMVVHPKITPEEFRNRAQKTYGDSAAEFLKLYPAATDEEAAQSFQQSGWDIFRVALNLYAADDSKSLPGPRFTYFWTHVMPGPESGIWGAFHTSDLPYEMDALKYSDRPFTPADHQVAAMMSSYWANFIATGNPNGKGLPRWPSVAEDPGVTMQLDANAHPIPVATSQARFEFFRRFLTAKAQPKP